MYKKVLKTTPSLFLRTLLRTVTRFLFFSLGKKKVGGKLTVSANRYHHSAPIGTKKKLSSAHV